MSGIKKPKDEDMGQAAQDAGGLMGPSPSPSVAGDLDQYNKGDDYLHKSFGDKFKDLFNGIDPLTGKKKK